MCLSLDTSRFPFARWVMKPCRQPRRGHKNAAMAGWPLFCMCPACVVGPRGTAVPSPRPRPPLGRLGCRVVLEWSASVAVVAVVAVVRPPARLQLRGPPVSPGSRLCGPVRVKTALRWPKLAWAGPGTWAAYRSLPRKESLALSTSGSRLKRATGGAMQQRLDRIKGGRLGCGGLVTGHGILRAATRAGIASPVGARHDASDKENLTS